MSDDDRYFLARGPVLLIGIAVGLIWIAMAATVLWSSLRGYANGRPDWGFGWGLVGVLLLAAGLSALIGTWWHVTRVRHQDH